MLCGGPEKLNLTCEFKSFQLACSNSQLVHVTWCLKCIMSREIVHCYPLFSGEMGIVALRFWVNLHEINLKNAAVWHSDLHTPPLPFFFFFSKQDVNVFLYFLQSWQFHHLYTLLTSTLFSLATDYTATSYIYQSLGDVEWYIKMKLSSWQQWVKYRKSPRRSQCSEHRSLESGD